MYLGMNHIALTVQDLEASIRFYESAFGMVPFGARKGSGLVQPLVSPRLRDQITLVQSGDAGELGRGLGTPGEQGGIEHFGMTLKPGASLRKVKARVEGAGGVFMTETTIGPGIPSLFFSDPDGYVIQLTRFPRRVSLYVFYLFARRWFGWSG